MKIEKLSHRSYNGEVATVSEGIVKTSENYDWSTDTFLTKLLEKANTESQKLSIALMQDRAVSELESKDETRDKALRAIFNLTEGYLYHPEETISAAAQTVNSVFDKYGLTDLIEANYAQESALIESLLKDMEAEQVKAAIDQLPGIAVSITNVRTSQNDFTESFLAYAEEKAKITNKETATKLKLALVKLINNELVIYLRAMTIAAPDTYGDFAAATAQIIADNNEKVRKRINRKQNATVD